MRRQDIGLSPRTDAGAARLPHVMASAHAAPALLGLCQVEGPKVIVLTGTCAAVSMTQVLNRCGFEPSPNHVVLGTVAHCPVYADFREITLCPHSSVVIDLHTDPIGGRATFAIRPECEAERQARVFTATPARWDGREAGAEAGRAWWARVRCGSRRRRRPGQPARRK